MTDTNQTVEALRSRLTKFVNDPNWSERAGVYAGLKADIIDLLAIPATPQHPAAGDMDALISTLQLLADEMQSRADKNAASAETWRSPLDPLFDRAASAFSEAAIALTPRPTLEDISPLVSELPWLVWSNEHRAFWRANRCGYTGVIEEAGRYTQNEAEAICRAASPRANSTIYADQAPEVCMPAPEALAVAINPDTTLLRTALADQQENIAAHLDEGYREAAERVREWKG